MSNIKTKKSLGLPKCLISRLKSYLVYRSKAVVPVSVLLFVACGLFYEAICFMSYLVLLCSCIFSVLLALRLACLGKRELILVLFVRLFDLCLFGFVGFLFLLVSGKGWVCDCGFPWNFLLPFFSYLINGDRGLSIVPKNNKPRDVSLTKTLCKSHKHCNEFFSSDFFFCYFTIIY